MRVAPAPCPSFPSTRSTSPEKGHSTFAGISTPTVFVSGGACAIGNMTRSLHPHARILDHLAPFRRLRPDALGECVRRAHDREDEVRLQKLLAERRVVEDALGLRIELGDDLWR